eukprot:CAMPEP_0114303978 /NCGR_PEP_ID=MMETSP0059-20121206/15526_1 /TAXON_ID=36894 /ORGANISM="Pyramimonas parkeae, Strain CCMP726" /LENGTH=85 /DNA_ID=CAMNT_0001427015 /DNA_START=289 /DNA_END=546 /DNA_ORIENTATION=+
MFHKFYVLVQQCMMFHLKEFPCEFCLGVLAALVAMQANAAEIMAAQPQEIAQIADITPVFYVGFLVASLGFTLTTYIVLNKIKLI